MKCGTTVCVFAQGYKMEFVTSWTLLSALQSRLQTFASPKLNYWQTGRECLSSGLIVVLRIQIREATKDTEPDLDPEP